MRRMIIAGNWKMNSNVAETFKLITAIQSNVKAEPENIDVVICPPFTALYTANVSLQESFIKLGAQNIHWEDNGAFTGEISGSFLNDVGCTYAVVGHSERRHIFGETDEMVNKKVLAALRNELIPIVCVGETLSERESGNQKGVVEKQIKAAFAGIHQRDAENIVVAYEPVWAIGTGKTATPDQAQEMHHFIRNLIEKLFDAPTANTIRLLYGGSVKASNSADLLIQKDIDGALIGGASLNGVEFASIIRAAPHKSL